MDPAQPKNDECPVPRWIHWWAVLTVCAAIPLVLLGAEVTTKQVGMADQVSLRTPWYLFTIPQAEFLNNGIGYVIEHSHRLAGWLVGFFAIILAWTMAAKVNHPRVRWLGLLALVMVSIQGILGIFRVKWNAWFGPDLALVHGLFAQLVIATLVGVALVTSRIWWKGIGWTSEVPKPRRLACLLAGMILLQVLFGAFVRHFQVGIAQRLHALFAFAVVVAAVWLARNLWENNTADIALRRSVWLLLGFLAFQIIFGVEAWIGRFGAGVPVETLPPNLSLDLIRSAHYLIGTVLFSTSVVVNMLLYRPAPALQGAATKVATIHPSELPASAIGGVA